MKSNIVQMLKKSKTRQLTIPAVIFMVPDCGVSHIQTRYSQSVRAGGYATNLHLKIKPALSLK